MRLWLLVVVVVLLGLAECGKIPQSGDFTDFVTKYGKKYVNEVEWTYRQSLFSQKLAHVNQHNSKSDRSYEKGINEFSDLTKDEFLGNAFEAIQKNIPSGLRKSINGLLRNLEIPLRLWEGCLRPWQLPLNKRLKLALIGPTVKRHPE